MRAVKCTQPVARALGTASTGGVCSQHVRRARFTAAETGVAARPALHAHHTASLKPAHCAAREILPALHLYGAQEPRLQPQLPIQRPNRTSPRLPGSAGSEPDSASWYIVEVAGPRPPTPTEGVAEQRHLRFDSRTRTAGGASEVLGSARSSLI